MAYRPSNLSTRHGEDKTMAYEPIFMAVPLDLDELLKAARLGGLAVDLDMDLSDADERLLNLICDFAREGMLRAITIAFDHDYPCYYPDDVFSAHTDDADLDDLLMDRRAAE